MPLPSWLIDTGPEGDVVVSTRIRYARNLAGAKFTRTADELELQQVQSRIERAALSGSRKYAVHRRPSEAERDYLLGCRMISPDFRHREPNRSLLIDESRIVSLMINEEDHLRLQALTSGLSIDQAEQEARGALEALEERLSFASHPEWGWLTSSPINAGEAHRRSVLVHLPALAHRGQLDKVKEALGALGAAVRGVFGEASRPVGEFHQVSMTRGSMADFRGACRYLLEKEREARKAVSEKDRQAAVQEAKRKLITAQEVTSAEAISCLSALRWERAAEGAPNRVKAIDNWISSIELQGTADPKTAARYRAVSLRTKLEQAERGLDATDGPLAG